MRPEYYADIFRRYNSFVRDFDGNRVWRIAAGANNDDYNWTRVLMQRAGSNMDAISFHYYTVAPDWFHKGSATVFSDAEYYDILGKAVLVEQLIRGHIAVMDEFDPGKRVALLLDEWGTWFDVEPGTNPGHLYQQNTMRDAMVAALSLNIFHKYTERLKMANIAQVVNVLQSMILTRGAEMLLTPTYHVFRMYNVHQGAAFVPVEYECGQIPTLSGWSAPELSVSASRDAAGALHVSLVNPCLDRAQSLELSFDSLRPSSIRAEILSAPAPQAHNDFGSVPAVSPAPFKDFRVKNGRLLITLPPTSIVVLEL